MKLRNGFNEMSLITFKKVIKLCSTTSYLVLSLNISAILLNINY